MGRNRRNGFVETETQSCDIGLGLMMETHDQSFACKKMNQMVMVMPHHELQICSGGFDGGIGSKSSSTPLFYNTSSSNPGTTDIYHAASSDFGSVVVPKNLEQPYYSDSFSFSSSGRDLSRTRGVRDMFEGFSKSMDPEPWRCKRTDGKKWRCSRNIAVDQKFCERHCHKRRSRKHVESIPNFLNNNNKNANMLSPKLPSFKNNNQIPFSSSMVIPAASSHGQPRGGTQGLQSQRSHDRLGGALNSNQAQKTRHFIDAWSTVRDGSNDEFGKRKKGSVALNQKLPLSSLTLSMSGENSEAVEECGNKQMSVGVLGSERRNVTQWMSPLSWMSSTPGGPLAEALCLGIASSTRTTPSIGCRSSNADARQEFDLIN